MWPPSWERSPCSRYVCAGDFIVVAGMFGLNDALEIVPGDLGTETCQILDNTVQLSQRSRESPKKRFHS